MGSKGEGGYEIIIPLDRTMILNLKYYHLPALLFQFSKQ